MSPAISSIATLHRLLCALTVTAPLIVAPAASAANASISGLWDASAGIGAIEVPFQFGIEQRGSEVRGWFFNGQERVLSDHGSYESGQLLLDFPTYARRVDVRMAADGTLSGTYGPAAAGSSLRTYTFAAHRASRSDASDAGKAPSIEGLWIVPAESDKVGEQAWRFMAHQSGGRVSAVILRVDGDSGTLSGHWQHGMFVLSHFDGARPLLLEVKPGLKHTLQLLVRNSSGTDRSLTGYRASDAKAQGIPPAADPATHTTVRDPNAPFQFSFPDLEGRVISNTDGRFRGKVLIIDVAGSWCPNCHDEAPFLQALYRKYHDRGLEVVTLSFEEPEQYANPERLRAFVKDFGIQYTVLLAGTLDELHSKVPQAVNLDAYPTTFFIGRDGRVKAVHAGYAAPATGRFNVELQRDFTTRVEQLLAQSPSVARVAARELR